ncbi:hypothetical protein [Acidithiobacillus sp.]|uniref:hypothetical protein n=1 Tax=Acidithiobacillus sp. TaxID=1872118 RepID=UPI00262A5E3F|nr:hypothetical protein [Acidithiobacillus sp.]MDD5281030.1 hypothetical protein [Acidithiobacillus sp.]
MQDKNPKKRQAVWWLGGIMMLTGAMTPWSAAQAQNIRPMTIQQLVNGPMFLHQGGPLTQLFHITGTPGDVAASRAALMTSIRGVGFSGLPAAQKEYEKLLDHLGIAQAVVRGNSFRLKQTAPHQSGGTASRPVLVFPVILQESHHQETGPWINKGPYTLRLTYVGHSTQKGFGSSPVLSEIALVRK